MLFRKKIERACQYCTHGTALTDGQILCVKRGVVDAEKPCRKFKYDPCKRIPVKAKPINFEQFHEEDFSL